MLRCASRSLARLRASWALLRCVTDRFPPRAPRKHQLVHVYYKKNPAGPAVLTFLSRLLNLDFLYRRTLRAACTRRFSAGSDVRHVD